jgi:hypothetical protein
MKTEHKPISELMTRKVCEVPTDWSAARILEQMQRMAVSSVLVVEDRLAAHAGHHQSPSAISCVTCIARAG